MDQHADSAETPAANPNQIADRLWASRDGAAQSVWLAQENALDEGRYDRIYLGRDNIPAVIARLREHHAQMCADLASRVLVSGPKLILRGGKNRCWTYGYIVREADREFTLSGDGSTSVGGKEAARRNLDRWLAERPGPASADA